MDKLKEAILQDIGEYSATVMADNPKWVFNARTAIKLADQIMAHIAAPEKQGALG